MHSSTPPAIALFFVLLAGQVLAPPASANSLHDDNRGDRAVFTDVTSGPLGSLSNTTGASWGDYDGDGDPDLYVSVVGDFNNQLLRNDGGDIFTNVTPVELGGQYDQGAVWGDYDNDGDLDIYLSNSAISDCLVRNDGAGVFTDVTEGILAAGGNGQGAAWGDFDQDGYIDLYVSNLYSGNRLMKNTGAADVFEDATCCSLDDAGPGWGVAWGDYDDDGDLDLYLVNYNAANRLYRNDGEGAFSDVTSGPLGDTGLGRSATWADYDNDGDLDIYVAGDHVNKLFRNDGGGVFTDATAGPLGQPSDSWGAAWGDYDNDGDLDVYVTNRGATNHLLENQGGGVFSYATSGPLADYGNGQGVAWADYDGDGDLDLFFGNGELESNHLLRNDGAIGHWLHLDLVGVQSNRSAIGARLRLVSAGQSQIREVSGGSCYGSQNSLTVEFGLGAAEAIDSVEIRWPSGWVQVLHPESVDTLLTVTEDAPAPPAFFTEVTEGPLVGPDRSPGMAWGDWDGDGLLDLYLSGGFSGQGMLLHNDGGGFSETGSGVAGNGQIFCPLWGDYDNDTDLDLLLPSTNSTNQLLRNDGEAFFTDVTSPPLSDPTNSMCAAWGDYDGDGNLDLYFGRAPGANVLLQGDGAGGFVDATIGALAVSGYSYGVIWCDYDQDGDPDLYVTNYDNNGQGDRNKLLRNEGGGIFIDVTTSLLADDGFGMSAAWGDYDDDGDLDLYLVNYMSANLLLRNDGAGAFSDATVAPLDDTGAGISATWGDYDKDGDLDLYLCNELSSNKLFRNEGDGSFSDVTEGILGETAYNDSAGWADYDNDGDLDLYFTNFYDSNHLLRNDLENDHHWLEVDLLGTQSNRMALGAKIRIVAGGRVGFRELGTDSGKMQNPARVHFGLGDAALVDTLEITWPSGTVQDTLALPADQRLVIIEELPGTGLPGEMPAPGKLVLHPCYPNPFNPKTTLRFDLPEAGRVSLEVYDVEGRLVKRLLDDVEMAAGSHELNWSGRDDQGNRVSSGLYYLHLEAGGSQENRVVTLLK